MSISKHHAEWLELIEVSGPFLTLPVLERVFPQGLDPVDRDHAAKLSLEREEWVETQRNVGPDADDAHKGWVHTVLEETLELGQKVLLSGGHVPIDIHAEVPEHREILKPDFVVVDPIDGPSRGKPRLLGAVWPFRQDLEGGIDGSAWAASPAERMTHLCRVTGVRLGLVTNGDRWMLVDAPRGKTPGYASCYSFLWFQEPLTLRAFRSLLGARRFFSVADTDTLEKMLEESVAYQEEVTDQLGNQVRRAVEVLIQALDRADVDRGRKLLKGVPPGRLYDAALTVMMRLVFLFCAEERGLLLLGDPAYDAHYAVSTLRGRLREEADRVGIEVLERRQDAWTRLLSTFRAVYAGLDHDMLRLPALGGSLFDPDRFPFLEGRLEGSSWKDTPAYPLPIDNRTVLHLLESLQLLQMKGREGSKEARRLSFRALDVEEIGYIYEGLLDHVAIRVAGPTLGLVGTKGKESEILLDDIEEKRAEGEDRLIEFLNEWTGRSASALKRALAEEPDETTREHLLVACGNDHALLERVLPFHAMVREDVWGFPQIYQADSFVVTGGPERRETGTHYTPKFLTEAIVAETLEPLTYLGPAEGKPREEWKLRTPPELLELKICDMAMGSGAFLVQACRWLAERLVEAWDVVEGGGQAVTSNGDVVASLDWKESMPKGTDDRILLARRLVTERSLYGVDINPMAVELAKLSLWLVTLAKGRPFGFLDHNLRCGDSLLGLHRLEQLAELNMNPGKGARSRHLFAQNIEEAVAEAIELRKQLRNIPIRDVRDVEAMAVLDVKARHILEAPEKVSDALVGEVLLSGNDEKSLEMSLRILAVEAGRFIGGDEGNGKKIEQRAEKALKVDLPARISIRKPFHWFLEFPEVFVRENTGFDVIIGNPPFLGNRLWKTMLGKSFQWQAQMILGTVPGKIDLCVLFHRRAVDLLRSCGSYGLLATSNISEGSTIAVGLGEMVKEGDIFFSRKGMPWPGTAAVVVAIVCFYKGSFSGPKKSDGRDCSRIGSRLEPEESITWEPMGLRNSLFCFEGVHNGKGSAFMLAPDDRWFDPLRSESNSLLRPYITGDDITSYSLQKINRWALDIGDMDLNEIRETHPLAYRYLQEVVRPTRTKESLKSYKGLHERWWQFWNTRATLMSRLRRNKMFVAYSKVTKYPICMLAPTEWIYTNKVLLIGIERDDVFPICLSSFFRSWMETFSGGSRGETLVLSIRESVEKFPLPKTKVPKAGTDAAMRFNDIAIGWSSDNGFGLTELMNSVHLPESADPRIKELRELLEIIDVEVAKAYGWHDLDTKFEFREFPNSSASNRWRFSINDTTRRELLHQLIGLNREHYDERIVPTS